MSCIISKETINRLLRDVKQIIKNPLTENGIYYIHDDTDMMKGYAMIIGPSDTPYFGGYYFFELTYPTDYPHSPPKVKYCTNANKIRFNPNLYTCGKVCISLLNTWKGDQWTSCQTISTVLLTLCTLLCDNPLLNEPGITINSLDLIPYNEIIQFSNLDIAICDLMNKKEGVYLPFFENFYVFMKEQFMKNYDTLLSIINSKHKMYGDDIKILKTGFYSMTIPIQYNNILTKITTIKKQLDSK